MIQATMAGLEKSDFQCIAAGGLGDPSSRIIQAMAWFKGRLYIGTGGRGLNPLGLSDRRLEALGALGVALRERDARSPMKPVGARIWRFDPQTGDWDKLYSSPLTAAPQGPPRLRDRNVRGSIVLNDRGQDAALYMGASSMSGQVVILRTRDGTSFTEVPHGSFGLGEDADIPSVRTFCTLRGRVFSALVGKNHDRGLLDDNMTDYPMVFETERFESGHWRPASAPGFGEPDNLSINELCTFENHIYAGTLNVAGGYQVWKANLQGKPPYRWVKIVDRGAFAGPGNSGAGSMLPFRGCLYVGSGLQRQGRGGLDRWGPVPGELIRIRPDDSWDLVVGEPRVTPDGLKVPISGLGAGFGTPFNRGVWCLAEHEGVLYAGCADIRIFQSFIPPAGTRHSQAYRQRLTHEAETFTGGYPLWRSADGENWQAVTLDGFGGTGGDRVYGIRNLVPAPAGLFVSVASANRGFQVWLGRRAANA